jgi:TolB protein
MTANRDSVEDIWTIDETSGAMTRVLHSRGGADVARWSPDGKSIAFGMKVNGAWQLHVVRPDGTGLRQITHGEAFATTTTWSPDGRRLAYECREGAVHHVCVIGIDGKDRRVLTPLP